MLSLDVQQTKPYTIAIVGRPNAGKSTLFNKLCHKNKAIVAKIPGVTRDFQIETIYEKEYAFNLIDTSGYEYRRNDSLQSLIIQHYERLLDDVDGFLFLCDGESPLSQLDSELLRKIRKKNKPFISAVNKIDTRYFKEHQSEFFEFFGTPFERLSSEKGIGFEHLLKKFESQFALTPQHEKPVKPFLTKAVIMGRPNVGKSTLMNLLLSKERVLVSPFPGTTRDPIDSMIQIEDKNYVLIDTAGLRKQRNISEKIESLSTKKGIASLHRADLVLLVVDASAGPTEQDVKIAELAWTRGVGVIILINKWDLLNPEQRTNTYWQQRLWMKFRMFNKIPFLFISATEERNIHKIFPVIDESKKMYEKVLDPKELNECFQGCLIKTRAPLHKISKTRRSRRVPIKFYTCKQINHAPPVFEIKTNFPKAIPSGYDQFLKNQFRETFGFWGIPVEIKYSRIH